MPDPERLLKSARPEVRMLLAKGWQRRELDVMTEQRVGHRLAALALATPLTLLGAFASGKAAASLLVAGTLAVAVGTWNLRYSEPLDATTPQPKHEKGRAQPITQPPAPLMSEDAGRGPVADVTPSASVASRSLRRASTARVEVRPPSNGVSEARSTLADELALLARARRAVAQSPVSALQIVEEHHTRFPTGQLRLEADVLAIRALVQLGRRSEAHQLAASLANQAPGSLYRERIAQALGEEL